ncbi:MAG: cupredoxin domain-containing protein [Gemmatimonadetes bacterium]|nr:cupredoxin domain-containing protein [Gemmatimonadota bacterium]
MRLARWILIGVVGVGGAACDNDGYGGGNCTSASAPNVNIQNTRFCPGTRIITTGTMVTWTNLDGTSHTTTSDGGSADTWSSGNLVPSETFSHQFNTPGTFAYHCSFHASMHGTIVVN